MKIQGQKSVLNHLAILSHQALHAPGKKHGEIAHALVDYDRKCCLIFCFTATHITNCLAAIQSFTLPVNNYSVKSDGPVQATKVSLGFAEQNCQARKSVSLRGKLHTFGRGEWVLLKVR